MIYILLPAYNEEESIDRVLPKIASAMGQDVHDEYHIIICNDGSKDKTLEKIQSYQKQIPITIINHQLNRGLGETARDLFEKAAEMAGDEDLIIRMDCDDTHDPEYIPGLVAKVKEGYDVVIASRFAKGGGQEGLSTYRALISWIANRFMKVLFSVKGVDEYSCGYRAYRASIIKKAIATFENDFVQLNGLGFTCTLEKLVKLNILGAKFGEFPFVLKYHQKRSPSKMVSSVTTLGYFTIVLLYYWPWGGWRRSYRHAKNLSKT